MRENYVCPILSMKKTQNHRKSERLFESHKMLMWKGKKTIF